MGGILSAVLDRKYKSILSWERSLAKATALAVLKADSISVWEVTIPFIFILNYMKLTKTREIATQNFLFTKKLALDGALDMTRKGQTRKEVMFRIVDKTGIILAADEKGIYSEVIRQRQLQEIDLLIDHYCKLLGTEGEDYTSLVMTGYQSRQEYTAFLEELKRAEKEVSLAASETLGTQADLEKVSTIEETRERVRMAEVEKVFGTTENAE
jgi:hypothetical protein